MSALAALPAPSDLVELPFMRDALIELALLGVAGGLLGAWIVLRRLAFFAHAVGTATFPGLVVADATGFSATLVGLAVALGYAGGVERLGGRGTGRHPAAGGGRGRARRRRASYGDHGDVATALTLVMALALGVVLASDVFESGAAVDRLLFGTALGLDAADLWVAAGAAALALAATLTLGRAWTAAGFDAAGAAALGLPLRTADLLLLGLIAAAAVAALPAVGALLVASLFVVPAATARQLTATVGGLLATAVAIAVAQAALGLYVSLWLDVPPGPAVAVVGSALYAAIALTRALTRPVLSAATAPEAT